MKPPPSSYRRRTSVAPVLWSIPPPAVGLGSSLGLADGPDGAALGAEEGLAPLLQAATETRRRGVKARDARRRDTYDMAAGRRTRRAGSETTPATPILTP
jgi:hypothetical protein